MLQAEQCVLWTVQRCYETPASFSVLQTCAVPEVRPPSPRDKLSVRGTQSCQTVVLEEKKVYLFQQRFGARGSTCGFKSTEGESENRSTKPGFVKSTRAHKV